MVVVSGSMLRESSTDAWPGTGRAVAGGRASGATDCSPLDACSSSAGDARVVDSSAVGCRGAVLCGVGALHDLGTVSPVGGSLERNRDCSLAVNLGCCTVGVVGAELVEVPVAGFGGVVKLGNIGIKSAARHAIATPIIRFRRENDLT